MLLFYFQTNKQKISSLKVVFKEELHTDTLHGQAESPLVEQKAHPAENLLCLCAHIAVLYSKKDPKENNHFVPKYDFKHCQNLN